MERIAFYCTHALTCGASTEYRQTGYRIQNTKIQTNTGYRTHKYRHIQDTEHTNTDIYRIDTEHTKNIQNRKAQNKETHETEHRKPNTEHKTQKTK